MSDIAIELSSVSKRYRLRGGGWYVTSIKDEVGRLSARLLGREVPPREEFWALRDVSFSLKRGDTLGLIGRNGAGKSTLLKVLSRVTVPTTGSFVTNGRLGSLIEIGAGFHPDLTGRENIFLNGSIMGMTRREVQRKFDQIVAFSEVERFIDTPIKHYSSGMQMRLGFAVAAHTDPDVLLIDEILAVGDASFQAKCLNKLTELKAQDKTIVLVSHNMTNITEQCKTVLWIDGGTVRMIGDPDSVVDAYLEHVAADMSAEESHHDTPFGRADSPLSILDVSIADDGERPQSGFDREDTVAIEIAYAASRAVPGVVFGVSIHDLHGHDLGGVLTDPDVITVTSAVERGVLRLTLSPLLFNKGKYTIAVHVFDPGTKRYYDLRRRAARLTVNGRHAGSRESTGYIHYPHQWERVK
ncbi:MAG: ABC transporter ATP-binding protein [Candidatus Rokuibacteriota bacterium]|nr:MAG: ABC transporter ATP-binding protein [Candidatus Rokubacteria bacterium]